VVQRKTGLKEKEYDPAYIPVLCEQKAPGQITGWTRENNEGLKRRRKFKPKTS